MLLIRLASVHRQKGNYRRGGGKKKKRGGKGIRRGGETLGYKSGDIFPLCRRMLRAKRREKNSEKEGKKERKKKGERKESEILACRPALALLNDCQKEKK